MGIMKKEDDHVLTLSLEGRLDTSSSGDLEKEIEELETEDVEELHLDLKDLDYTSSAGLRVILKAQQLMSRRHGMIVYNVKDEIRDIFDLTGFLNILTIQ
jgi:anti-sigma B factor antagonist